VEYTTTTTTTTTNPLTPGLLLFITIALLIFTDQMARRISFPVPYKELRELCIVGEGLTTEERIYWWSVFVNSTENELCTSYLNTQIAQAKLNDAAKVAAIDAANGDAGFTMVEVFHILTRVYNISPKYVRRLYKIISDELISHPYGPAIVYQLFESMIKNKSKYGSFNSASIRLYERIFPKVIEAVMPKTHTKLKQIRAYDDKHLNLIFFEFFTELLSKQYVLRIIDAYLLEGQHVLLLCLCILVQ
jgi:hypothetical protein